MKLYHLLILSYLIISVSPEGETKEECTNLNEEYACNISNDTEYPESWDERSFQTPPRDDTLGNYRETYQDMHYIVGYAQLLYSTDKKVCTINFITRVNPKLGEEGKDYKILYKFGEKEQESNTITLTSDDSYPDGMPVSAKIVGNDGKEIAKLELEDEYFMWDNPPVDQGPEYENGQKGAIVELFGWPYDDIAEECEFIGNAGYMAVKVFPCQEAILTFDTLKMGN